MREINMKTLEVFTKKVYIYLDWYFVSAVELLFIRPAIKVPKGGRLI